MRNMIAGLAVVGVLGLGTGVPATAHPVSVSPAVAQLSDVQKADWDGCGPRCWEHRRWVREQQHERWVQHRRWEEHRRWEDGQQPAYGYSPRY